MNQKTTFRKIFILKIKVSDFGNKIPIFILS